jgi:hypothetical protein
MTRSINPDKGENYLRKADASLSMAKIAITKGAYDNAVMSAVHGAINALDALTTSYLGKRSSGAHTDAVPGEGNIQSSRISRYSKAVLFINRYEKCV